jgi:vacuolar-type H+-ATPase subunit D/Vma8
MRELRRLRRRLDIARLGRRLLREKEEALRGRLASLSAEMRENRRRLNILEKKCIPELAERIRVVLCRERGESDLGTNK